MKRNKSLKATPIKMSSLGFNLDAMKATELDDVGVVNSGHSVASINSYLDKKRRKRKSKRTLITLLINDPPYEFPIKK